MTLFALTVPSALLFVSQATFTLYVLVSFIVVAKYVTRKVAAGRLVNGRAAPMSLSIPPSGRWLFIFNIVMLLFVNSEQYRAVMLAAVVIFLAVDRALSRDEHSLARAGAWLFIGNVIALLYTVSPLYMLLIVIGQAVLLLENRRLAPKQFGLERLSPAQLIKWSMLICGAVIVVVSPVLQVFELALDFFHFSHPEQQSVEVFRKATPSQIVDFLIQAVVLAPMIEELFFRGFLLTYLKTHMSTWLALIVSAGIFAIAHQNLDSVLPLWLLGIVLGVAYEHTGCLLLPIGIHACFNLTTGLTLLGERASP